MGDPDNGKSQAEPRLPVFRPHLEPMPFVDEPPKILLYCYIAFYWSPTVGLQISKFYHLNLVWEKFTNHPCILTIIFKNYNWVVQVCTTQSNFSILMVKLILLLKINFKFCRILNGFIISAHFGNVLWTKSWVRYYCPFSW